MITKSELTFKVSVDGACYMNPGPMGFAALVEDETGITEHTGFDDNTGGTNNRAEIKAAILGLSNTPEGSTVTLFSDSTLVTQPFAADWISNWKANARDDGTWRNSSRKPVKNQDLYEQLIALVEKRKVTFVHRYRCSTPELARADALANAEATKHFRQSS